MKPKLRERLVVRKESWGAIVCDKLLGVLYKLNHDAHRMLAICNGERRVEDIVQVLAREYETKPSEIKPIVEKYLETLLRQHIIVDRHIDLNELAERHFEEITHKTVRYGSETIETISGFERFREHPLSAPLSVSFEVTFRCNLRCKHCYANAGDPLDGELSTKQIMRFIERLAEMQVFSISLTGGEPMTRKDILQIIRHCVDHDLGVLLSTNGTLVNREAARKLKKIGGVAVQVSIDSVNSGTHDSFRGVQGAHQQAKRGLKNILNVGIEYIRVATVASRLNFNEIPLLVDELDKMGVSHQRILRFLPLGRGKTQSDLALSNLEIKHLLETLEKKQQESGKITIDFSDAFNPPIVDRPTHACTGGVLWCAVNPKGYVVPCTYLNSMKTAIDLKAESIMDKDFKEIWENYNLFEILRNPNLFLKDECAECNFKRVCGGGCRAAAYAHSQDILGHDPHCTYRA